MAAGPILLPCDSPQNLRRQRASRLVRHERVVSSNKFIYLKFQICYAYGMLHADLVQNEHRAMRAAEMIKAMAHPIRLRIIALLCDQPLHVSALTEHLQLKQAVVSQQLRILRMHGLVESERLDGFSYYRLANPRLKSFLNCVEGCSID